MATSTEGSARAFGFRALADGEVAVRVLRADSMPVIAGVLGAHLGGDTRRRPADELMELVEDDLDVLRAHGQVLPKSAAAYLADWRAVGYLIRRPTEDARGETVELSAGALTAIRFLESVSAPTSTVTESRLTTIGHQLTQLAIDTDTDLTRRLATLTERRAELDAEIERVRAGDVVVLADDRAVERTRDILAQIAELPADFARVRQRFESINTVLHEQLLETDATQRRVLDEVFRGVDLIAESDEGRSFDQFLRLVLDERHGADFDRAVEHVLDREFASALSATERRTLRRLLSVLKREGREIHSVVGGFARGLRRYVQSQQYERDRAMRLLLRRSLAAGLAAAAEVRPWHDVGRSLDLSTVQVASIGAIVLHDPDLFDVAEPVDQHAPATIDLEALRLIARDTEIDFAELEGHIATVRRSIDRPSVGDVLERFPATQGVASVVGLISLAGAHGVRDDGDEPVSWDGADGVRRRAAIPVHRFPKETA